MNFSKKSIYKVVCVCLFPVALQAQVTDTSRYRVKTDVSIPFNYIATIKPVKANEVKSSNWILGCETLDRDFTDYEEYKPYLVPLGVKRLRMQAGWAKTEKSKGVYSWQWLDKIIDDAVSRGLQPWLETSYGNSIYAGGGGENLSAGIPTSAEALAAWDKWVEALTRRYKDKVKDWEVWNEPNFGDNEINTAQQVADLNIRTAKIIKRVQPEAKISGLAMGHIDLRYAEAFFDVLRKKNAFNLFDNFTYHDYVYNPDANYCHVGELKDLLRKYDKNGVLRQGENGCPSEPGGGRGALGSYDWTELSQAKWITRRMLGDLGHDIESSILGIIDIAYNATGPINRLNVKGLLKSDTTKKVIRPKMAYYAMQNVVSIFDHSLQRIKSLYPTHNSKATAQQGEVRYANGTDRSLSFYGYENASTKKQAFTIWSNEAIPQNTNPVQNLTISIVNGSFDTPVFVDILTGIVYEIPAKGWSKKGNTYTFTNIPIYDAPVLIVDKSLLKM
jgi:hypothetical protein